MPRPSPGDLPDPGIETTSPASPALVGRFFTTSTTGEAPERRKKTVENNKSEVMGKGSVLESPHKVLFHDTIMLQPSSWH